MDLLLTDDQQLFLDAATRFMDAECPPEQVRARTEQGAPADDAYLRRAADLGWFAFFVPEALGGGSVSGRPVLDACLVAEERGRRLQPGPFVAGNVVAWVLAADADRHADVLGALATGDLVATWAAADGVGSHEPGAGAVAVADGDGFVLNGTKGLVEEVDAAQVVLVDTTFAGGIAQFLVPLATDGVEAVPGDGLDITRRLGEIRLTDVRVPASAVVGRPGEAGPSVARAVDLAAVLVAAETVGAVDHLFEMTRQYALDRVAFGRPIGSFQAIKHLLADLATMAEAGKAVAVAAARALQDRRPDASETASIAKAFIGETGVDIAQGCFQVHGGIGFTWEHDLHLYLRRITASSVLHGDPAWHRERICRAHGL